VETSRLHTPFRHTGVETSSKKDLLLHERKCVQNSLTNSLTNSLGGERKMQMLMNMPMAVVHLHTVCFALGMHDFEIEVHCDLRHPLTGRLLLTLSSDVKDLPHLLPVSYRADALECKAYAQSGLLQKNFPRSPEADRQQGDDLPLATSLASLTAHNLDTAALPILTVTMPPCGSRADIRVLREDDSSSCSKRFDHHIAALRDSVSEVQSHWTRCSLRLIDA